MTIGDCQKPAGLPLVRWWGTPMATPPDVAASWTREKVMRGSTRERSALVPMTALLTGCENE